jgi:outer membrane protein OmpA-like peptidoglycan-associated protein
MRKLGLTLLVGSMVIVPYAAFSQDSSAPSADQFVCALTGECGDEPAAEEQAPAQPGEGPRVSATRGFSLSRPSSPQATPNADRPTRAQTTSSQRQRQRQRQASASNRQRGPAQQQVGRVDLRLNFATGSAELSAADQARILAFAEALKRPQLANVRVRIEGHTDSVGGRASNLTLSQRRAQAVADFLTAQGISAERLEVRGYGYDRPLPGHRASSGENRRVEAVRIS